MSRLIDADLLKDNIIKCLKPLKPEEEMIDSDVALLSTIMEIDNQQTAFDVDKISKELVKQKKIANKKMNESDDTYNMSYYDGFSSGIAIAIGIVKGGRVE